MEGTKRGFMAGLLAGLAMVGFLCVIGFLTVGTIPEGNRDFFNMALVALIGFVGTAFGYFLGSSDGSARKNDLLAQRELPPSAEAGFARFGLLFPLSFVLLLGFVLLAGCATLRNDTPEALAAKSLLTAKEGIVAAARTGDALCDERRLAPEKCGQLADYYRRAMPAYDLAADSLAAAIRIGDAQGWARYQAARHSLFALYDDMLRLTKGGAQ